MNTSILRNTKHITVAAVAAVCLSAVAGVGVADEATVDVPARTVHYADLDLGTKAGATTLYARIREAAEQVCGDGDSRELARVVAAKACVDRAIAASVHTVNNPGLTSVYDAHLGARGKAISVASIH